MKKIAIIGCGIAGLAAAYSLEKARRSGAPLDYRLFDASSRPGGVLRTESVEGCIVEAGTDSFLTEKTWATDFCRELGLGDQLIHSNDAQRKTYIYAKNRLIPIPDGLMFLVPTKIWPIVFSSLFSPGTKLRMAREWFSSRPQAEKNKDESVADFINRHYGPEMVDRLASPMLAGVYGGSAANLSAQSVLPRFVAMEKEFGSLGRGMIAARKRIPANPPPVFTSLKGGMQQLPDAVLAKIPSSSIETNARIDSAAIENNQWIISRNVQSERFDAIIMAVPTYAAASILQPTAPDLAQELNSITYTSSVTVAMGFHRNDLKSLPPGFGFLVSHGEARRREQKHILAATFVDQKFPNRCPADLSLIRCFLRSASSDNESILHLDENAIAQIARDELRQILGLNATPVFARVFKWSRAMAQYNVGHSSRMERIHELSSRLPGFTLAGNAYQGIGIPDCIRSGTTAAEKVLAELAK